MPEKPPVSGESTAPGRRGFIVSCAAAATALLAVRVSVAESGEERSVAFVHTHTGERLTARYYVGGVYVDAVLAQVNLLLRDFRDGTVHPIDPLLLDRLYRLQAVAGGSEPFQVISAYRSPATNATLRQRSSGVAEHSLHMEGRAIDVRLPGLPTENLARLAVQQSAGGVGFYRLSDFVHLDTGRVRSWGDPLDP